MAQTTLEPLTLEGVDEAMAIIEQAREFLRQSGSTQWQNAYPQRCDLEADARDGVGWFLVCDGNRAGYACIDFRGEPVYDAIDGAWVQDGPYGTIHRMAMGEASRGRGLAPELFKAAEGLAEKRGVKSLRIDTAEANAIMQHLVAKEGFVYCGMVQHAEGPRLAYEKLIG